MVHIHLSLYKEKETWYLHKNYHNGKHNFLLTFLTYYIPCVEIHNESTGTEIHIDKTTDEQSAQGKQHIIPTE